MAAQLRNWNRQYKLDRVADSSVGHRLPDGSTLPPGASWVSVAAWQTLPAATRRNFLPVFVVEVMSPSDKLATEQAKTAQWLANRVLPGFLLCEAPETAYVYHPGQPEEALPGFDRELSAGPVLTGWRLDLREPAS